MGTRLVIALGLVLAGTPAAALEGHEGVYEEPHDVHVTLLEGVAIVETVLHLRSTSAVTSEVHVDLEMAGEIDRVRVCIESRCRESVADRPGPVDAYALCLVAPRAPGEVAPIAIVGPYPYAFVRRPRRRLRVAPVSSAHGVDVTIRSIVPTELHGGRVWLELPLTGPHPDVGAVTVSAPGLLDPRVEAGPPELPANHPWAPRRAPRALVRATLPSGATLAASWRVGCGSSTCVRSFLGTAWVPRPRDIVIALDASASMGLLPEGAVERSLEGLLAALPEGSTARVVAFGRDLEVRVATPLAPSAIDARAVAIGGLGNVTRTEPVLEATRAWLPSMREPLLVIVTDGDLSLSRPPPGLEVSIVQLAEEPLHPSAAAAAQASGGVVVALASSLARPWPLRDHLAVLTAARAFDDAHLPGAPPGALRSGEALAFEGVGLRTVHASGADLRPRGAPAAIADGLARRLARLGHGHVGALVAIDLRAFAAARAWADPSRRHYPRVPGAIEVEHRLSPIHLIPPCDPATLRGRLAACGRPRTRVPRLHCCGSGVEVRGSISREAIGRMMRGATPAVRGCLARARRGRRAFDARFAYELVLHRGEVRSAAITRRGADVDEALVACLLDRPIASLVVPLAVNGAPVGLTYPYRTEGSAEPAEGSLDPDVDALLEAAVDEP